MGLQSYIDGVLQAQRAIKAAEAKQLTLRALIDGLKAADASLPVVLDTGEVPGKLDSWRGIYAELAMSFDTEGATDVATVLADAESAVGAVFTGYKGGDFLMRDYTPIWLANYGSWYYDEGGERMLTGVVIEPERVVITSAYGES